jgi:hypothetical protein
VTFAKAYPNPIVDHPFGCALALTAFAEMRGKASMG